MQTLENLNARGERARLFPVLSESSKEGRTLSIVLATMARVPEFAAELLKSAGRRPGARTKVEAFTEVSFPKAKSANLRPDGLLIVDSGRTVWRAFVEAKIGTETLKQTQLENYLRLAREVDVDAVITFSNEFAALPEHHPTQVDQRLTKKVELLHFSWFSLLTMINLLAENEDVNDEDHVFLLRELERFLLHKSAGLKRFDSMGPEWTRILDTMRTGAPLSKTSNDVVGVAANWQAELRDMCLLLSRKTSASVDLKLAAKHRSDPRGRLKADCLSIADYGCLSASIDVVDAAAPIDIEVDLTTRTIRVSMKLAAPGDRVQQRSRLNWLLRQLEDQEGEDIRILCNWPGRAPQTASTLRDARDDESIHSHPDKSMLPNSFVVMKLMTDGRKFAGRKTFVGCFEELVVEDFYGSIVEHLTAWQPPARKLRAAVEEANADEEKC